MVFSWLYGDSFPVGFTATPSFRTPLSGRNFSSHSFPSRSLDSSIEATKNSRNDGGISLANTMYIYIIIYIYASQGRDHTIGGGCRHATREYIYIYSWVSQCVDHMCYWLLHVGTMWYSCYTWHFWMFLFFELGIKKVKQGNKTKKNPEHPENLTVNRYEKRHMTMI